MTKQIEDAEYMATVPTIAIKQQIATNQALQLLLQNFIAIFLGKPITGDDMDHLIAGAQHLSDLNKIYLTTIKDREVKPN